MAKNRSLLVINEDFEPFFNEILPSAVAMQQSLLVWRPLAQADRAAIMDYIAQDNPIAALELDEEFDAKAAKLRENPTLFRPGRLEGTREIVIRANYVMVYRVGQNSIEILRVLHAAQQWPPG